MLIPVVSSVPPFLLASPRSHEEQFPSPPQKSITQLVTKTTLPNLASMTTTEETMTTTEETMTTTNETVTMTTKTQITPTLSLTLSTTQTPLDLTQFSSPPGSNPLIHHAPQQQHHLHHNVVSQHDQLQFNRIQDETSFSLYGNQEPFPDKPGGKPPELSPRHLSEKPPEPSPRHLTPKSHNASDGKVLQDSIDSSSSSSFSPFKWAETSHGFSISIGVEEGYT